MEPLLLSPIQVSELLNVNRQRVYYLTRRGDLASFKEGKHKRIPVGEVERYIARRLAENPDDTSEREPVS